MNNIYALGFFILTYSAFAKAQSLSSSEADSLMMKSIYDFSLTESKSYDWLDYLSNNIGGRLSGSIQAERAVKYTEKELKKFTMRTEL